MQWFGILAILFIFFALAGFVYIGANTDKLGFGFGEPNEISKQFTAPSSDLPPFELQFPSLSTSEYISRGDLDLDKFESDLRVRLSQAESPQEMEEIMMEMAAEVLDSPRVEEECKQVLIELQKEQNKMIAWSESGKDPYSFPIEKTQELYKQWGFCSAGFQLGLYDRSDWGSLLDKLENP